MKKIHRLSIALPIFSVLILILAGCVVVEPASPGPQGRSFFRSSPEDTGTIYVPFISGLVLLDGTGSSPQPSSGQSISNSDLIQAADASGNVDTVTGAGCMQDVYDAFGQGGSLNCTANDVSLATARNITILDDGCAFPGDTVTFTADFEVVVTAGARNDVGIYFALDGDPNSDGALTGACTISTPAYAPGPEWLDLDGTTDNTTNSNDFGYCSFDNGATLASPTTPCDGGSQAAGDAQCVAALGAGATCQEFGDGIQGSTALQDTCGDISKPDFSPLYPTVELTVACVDGDRDGQLDLPYCTSWRQSGANELCLTPLAAYPGAPSKCNCDGGFGIDINVPGQIIVDKVTVPASEPTSFNFTLDGPDADAPLTFSLTDQAPPFESPGLNAGIYSVVEATNSSYATNATCDDGSDPSAIDLQPGETVVCTFTNAQLEGPPSINVIKTADPVSLAEPGGNIEFTVVIENTSGDTDPITISSLTDSIYGNLDNQGTCSLPQIIQPGNSYTCTFSANVTGDPGYSENNVVTAIGADDEGVEVSDNDDATVTIVDSPATIDVIKTASPTTVDEPGGSVTFNFQVDNTSQVDTITIDNLNDSIYGNLDGQGNCSIPQTIAAGGSYSCSITVNVSGNGGDTETNVITASGIDDDGNPISGEDDETVTINDLPSSIEVVKTANPESVAEPGGEVTFTFVVNNTSAVDEVIINSLTDSIYGNLNGQGNCSIPQAIAAGDSYVCSLTTVVEGNAGAEETNVVTAVGTDDDGNTLNGDDQATVTVTDLPSDIEVIKTADPMSVDEPGGDVTFTFVVNNISEVDTITINNLTDSIYGNLNGQGNCAVPQVIAAGASYICSFTTRVSGNAGQTETNVVTVTGTDDDGNDVSGEDNAEVTINDLPATIEIIKTADPTTVDEPGGDVTFTFVVKNTSAADAVTINSLSDSIYGDLTTASGSNCSVPQTLGPDDMLAGGSDEYICSMTVFVDGNANEVEFNVATVLGTDDDGNPVSDTDEAAVTLNNVQGAIELVKIADPTAVTEPGGTVNFNFTVNNLSIIDAVTINSLTDSIYGDLNGQGDCSVPQTIAPSGSYTCSFSANVSGNAGATEVNWGTATGVDDDGDPVTDTDDATVTIEDAPSAIEIIKTADPISVDEPGGDVTFTFIINNLSEADTVTIDRLTDSIYGDLNGQGNCLVPQTLAVDGGYTCSVTLRVEGNAADVITNVATGAGVDDDGVDVSDSDDAEVTILDVPSSIEATKVANPGSIDEPGGDITFDYTVENTSAVDQVTITSLNDSIYGDLTSVAGSTCSVPQTLAVGASYSCSITVFVGGNAFDTETNVFTASGIDDDNTAVTDDDDELVQITDVPSSIKTTKTATPSSVPETGGDVTFTVMVENTSLVDNVTIENVNDSVFGDVSQSCVPALPANLAPGDTVSCAFTRFLDGDAGESHVNVATASGTDDDGQPVTDDGEETVPFEDVLPDITLVKSANPPSVPETGGDVTFTFFVTNNSLEDATLDSLIDSDFGNLNGQGNCAVPQSLAADGGTYSCSITVFLSGDASGPDHSNIGTAVASDDDGNSATDEDEAIVPFDDVLPDVTIEKSANPESVLEPGDDVEFTIVVTNNSLENATINSLVDTDFNLAIHCPDAIGSILSSGASYRCTFTEFVGGNVGEDHQNSATVVAVDNDGNLDTETDDAIVTIANANPAISVVKSADQAQVYEPGEDVIFTVVINNDSVSTDPVTINSLTDNVHGNLNGQGDCTVPQVIEPSGSYSCTFTAFVDGDEVDVITANGTDDEGTPVSGSDDAFVDMINPSVSIEKLTEGFDADTTPGPEILNNSDVNWSYVVSNDGDVALNNLSVIDNQGATVSCPQTTLAVDESVTCSATGTAISGQYANVGTTTANHTDLDGDSASPTDSELSHYFGATPSIDITKSFATDSVVAGDSVGSSFTLVVTNDGNVALSDVLVADVVNARLEVTNVSGTEGSDANTDGNPQTINWVIPSLGVGESATITVNFVVRSSTAASSNVNNTASATSDYADDAGNTTTVTDSASDVIDIFTDINLSITKTFASSNVPQGTPSSFTIEVSNSGPSDAVDVAVTDLVDGSLIVTAVNVTSGGGDCSSSQEQSIDCTVQIPAGQSVEITVDYLASPFYTGAPQYGTTTGAEFRFVFVNGSVLEGSAGGEVYLDGVLIDTVSGRNEYLFNAPDGSTFTLHLSCSDAYAGGWGDTGGPVEGVDTNWQIAYFSITRYQDGNFFRNCGNVVNPFDVPNIAGASGSDSFGVEVVSDDATVTVEPGITLDRLQTTGKRLTVRLTNYTGENKEIADITIMWPSSNGNLTQVRLDEPVVWRGNLSPTSATLDANVSGWRGGTLLPGDAILRFDFRNKTASSGYTIRVNFTDGTFLDITQ